jgi:hypothetical protein
LTVIAVRLTVWLPTPTLPTSSLQIFPPVTAVTGIVVFAAASKYTPHCVTPATRGSVTTNGAEKDFEENRRKENRREAKKSFFTEKLL